MRYFRAGQSPDTDNPTILPVSPGPKMRVSVTLLVDAADPAAATDCLNSIFRDHETFLTDGPLIDWAFGPLTPYTPPDPYEEGMAFYTPQPDLLTVWQDLGRRIAERLGPAEADILYDPDTFGDDDGSRSPDAMTARIQAIVVDECQKLATASLSIRKTLSEPLSPVSTPTSKERGD
ncbi:hypothetical protein SAMN00768000_3651 [Sulfobacillus thermosulfidooxidans DSM 9293]|uniref:Uncharacterized protein n=1 Tax=Sulfobacillus thermosulfidooxidans (strain DSM 9293 / VKM B-1269 / AT-1) TaxID=929705 RepID=A0A1W1WQ11_SULTA|nr:hypothetical protein [Sulfobacillus thermosulfidooxidans]SMC08100.1 hypothetical protein SAMN00768000_3651 [Sulfobacillus thermosulfidooxidans DSM 9293]